MKQQVRTTRERLDGSASIAAQFGRFADGVAEGDLDTFSLQTRQHGIDGHPTAVTRDEDRDLFLRQAALGRLPLKDSRIYVSSASTVPEGVPAWPG